MKPIRSLYYKAQGKPIDVGISVWTGLLAVVSLDFKRLRYNYSHVELWFPDEGGNFIDDEFVVPKSRYYLGTCFSSTMRGNAKGVRFAPASEVLRHPENWDYTQDWVPDERYDIMYQAALGEVGKEYDFAGVFTGFFMLAPYLQNDKKRYCSDICYWLKFKAGLIKKRLWIISPRRAAELDVKRGLKIKPLVKG